MRYTVKNCSAKELACTLAENIFWALSVIMKNYSSLGFQIGFGKQERKEGMGRARENTKNANYQGWSEVRHQAGLDELRGLVLTKQ
jgi:hypothetical protein